MASNADFSAYGNYAAAPRRERRRERLDAQNRQRIDFHELTFFNEISFLTMEDYLMQPPEDAVQTTTKTNYIDVDYSALKTPAQFVRSVNADFISDALLNCKLGFHYYDKTSKTRLPLKPFTFFVLEVYSGLTGAEKDAKGEWSNFWSNRVKDTRTQPYTLYVNGSKTDFSGLWNDIYDSVIAKYGKAVKNVRIIVAYCKELDAVVEIPLTAFAERGVKKSIADSQNALGKKIKWDKVSLYGLADNDHIWGFSLKDFEQVGEKGETYEGKGDLFFSPVFHCGILRPDIAPELHETCVEYQRFERNAYAKRGEAYKQRAAQQEPATPQPVGSDADFPTHEVRNFEDNIPTDEPLPF